MSDQWDSNAKCGRCGHYWDWHGKRDNGACKGGYLAGMAVAPCQCRQERGEGCGVIQDDGLAMKILDATRAPFCGTVLLAPHDANRLASEADQNQHAGLGRVYDFHDGDRFTIWGRPGIVSDHVTPGTAVLCPVRI